MEDGPYRNTRSSAGSLNQSTEKGGHFENLDSTNLEVFQNNITPNTPKNREVNTREQVRTPSGHLITNSVGDIRNFFDKSTPGEAHPNQWSGKTTFLSSQASPF